MAAPKKTHCKRGHERIPENLYKRGVCKICSKERVETEQYKIMHRISATKSRTKKIASMTEEELLKFKAKTKQYTLDYKARHPEKIADMFKKVNRRCCDELTNAYIANTMKASVKDVPLEILNLKRHIILFQREIRNAGNRKSIGTNQ